MVSPSTTSLTALVFGSRETQTRVWKKNTSNNLQRSSWWGFWFRLMNLVKPTHFPTTNHLWPVLSWSLFKGDTDTNPLQRKENIFRGRNKLLAAKLHLGMWCIKRRSKFGSFSKEKSRTYCGAFPKNVAHYHNFSGNHILQFFTTNWV